MLLSPGSPQAWEDVLAERSRQIVHEEWSPTKDDGRLPGALALGASAYICHTYEVPFAQGYWSELDEQMFKPSDKRSNLVKAGALILAEIERLDRESSDVQCGKG